MRPPVDEDRLRELARRLGGVARAPTRIYLADGARAVLEGWRASTVDVDLRFEPELYRYPAIDPSAFREKVETAFS
jgi:hypothetical protein